ncbi:MAG: beta-ketoacyl-ACP synthase III [Gammaproteobacteria bacterium]|jgi:3-oxoacyl-[acyl-carrier-protein] synthase-3
MTYTRIIGTGSYLPEKIITNFDLEKIIDTTDEWIVTRTGIHNRHVADAKDVPVYMAEQAAKEALAAANIKSTDIELILVTTVSPEKFFPSTACLLEGHLQTNNCMAFDLNAACSGFIYGLTVADQFIRAGTVKRALVVSTEVMTSFVDWQDRNTCVLFGDGAAAVVVEASNEPGIITSKLHADGKTHEVLYSNTNLFGEEKANPKNARINMKGRELYKPAIAAMVSIAKEVLADANMGIDDVDWLIPHQANQRMIEMVIKKLGIASEKVIITIDEHANTSSASVPLALDYALRNNLIQPGQNVVLDAFGAGLAWGAILVKF